MLFRSKGTNVESVNRTKQIEAKKQPNLTYMDLVAICIGRFNLSLLESKRCTPVDFEIYNKGYLIRNQEKTRLLAMQAWLNQSVQATKKRGKTSVSVYKDFDDFYNSEEQFNRIFESPDSEEKPKILSLADKNRMLSKSRKKGGK